MSSDLFAAFGDTSQSPQLSGSSSNAPPGLAAQQFSFFDDLRTPPTSTGPGSDPQQQQQHNIPWPQSSHVGVQSNNAGFDQDDDFGDFEDASPSLEPPKAQVPTQVPVASTIDDFWGGQPEFTSPVQPQAQNNKPTQPPAAFGDPWGNQSASTPSVQQPTYNSKPAQPQASFYSAPKSYSTNLLDLDDAFKQPTPPQNPPLKLTVIESEGRRPSVPQSPEFKRRPSRANAPLDNRTQARLDRIAPDPDVLFDVTESSGANNDDDDFGEFEGDGAQVLPPQPQQSNTASVQHDDLFSFSQSNVSTTPTPPTTSRARKALSNADLLGELGNDPAKVDAKPTVKPAAASFQPRRPSATPTLSSKADDSWNEFDDWDASATPTAPPQTTRDGVENNPILSSIQPKVIPEPSGADLPPTNIPPPAVVLSLFPPIFADTQKKLFKPLAAQPYQLKNRILSDPATISFLRGYILLATVAARVIAGRKQRWKRDKHLSQGMRIGPASSRATSGMKLTGIDRGEDLKEDREVLDVVRSWKEQIGRLRSAVAGVNSVAGAGLGPVFELQEMMPVRTAKENEGAMRAPQPCALCGLKRDERIAKVDGDVQDSFGEWWIDQMSMHRACRNFWEEHKATLQQR